MRSIVLQENLIQTLNLNKHGRTRITSPPRNTSTDHLADLAVVPNLQERPSPLEATVLRCQFIWVVDWIHHRSLHPPGIQGIPRPEAGQHQQMKKDPRGRTRRAWQRRTSSLVRFAL